MKGKGQRLAMAKVHKCYDRFLKTYKAFVAAPSRLHPIGLNCEIIVGWSSRCYAQEKTGII